MTSPRTWNSSIAWFGGEAVVSKERIRRVDLEVGGAGQPFVGAGGSPFDAGRERLAVLDRQAHERRFAAHRDENDGRCQPHPDDQGSHRVHPSRRREAAAAEHLRQRFCIG